MTQRALLDAIYVRDTVNRGMADRRWTVEQVARLARENVWTDSQIAAIVGYTPGSIRRIVAKSEARSGSVPPQGGTLHPSALDIMLALTGELTRVQQANLLTEAIKTGTSTKLISRLCDIPLGSVLYQQRKYKKEENGGFDPEPEQPEAVPGLQG